MWPEMRCDLLEKGGSRQYGMEKKIQSINLQNTPFCERWTILMAMIWRAASRPIVSHIRCCVSSSKIVWPWVGLAAANPICWHVNGKIIQRGERWRRKNGKRKDRKTERKKGTQHRRIVFTCNREIANYYYYHWLRAAKILCTWRYSTCSNFTDRPRDPTSIGNYMEVGILRIVHSHTLKDLLYICI